MTSIQLNDRCAEAARLIDQGQHRNARRVLELAIAENPNDTDAWHLLGTAAYRDGDLDTAEQSFRHRLTLSPDDPVAHYSLAIAVRDRGETDDAIRQLHQALALRPDFTPARDRLTELERPTGPNAPAAGTAAESHAWPTGPDAPRASNPSEIIGIATAVRSRVVPDPWLGRGQISVLTFRVARQDTSGQALPPVPVELRGAEIDGDILEGDPVSAPGAWQPGRASMPRSVTNLRTMQEIRVRRGARIAQLLIVAAFVIAFAAFVVVALATR